MASCEFSRIVKERGLTAKCSVTYEATPRECAEIAKRLGIIRVDFFKVRANFEPKEVLKNVHAKISLKARLWQECVLSLEPFKETIEADFSLILEPAKRSRPAQTEILYEGPEVVSFDKAGEVDLGEICVQYLSLALDPFPRKPDISAP